MKRPNFFILGAPKCGTTSLAAWLGEHPNVFMSTPKEPRFFDTDFRVRGRRTLAEYEKLFARADGRHLRVGEASVYYLRSQVALSRILAFSEDSLFIVCVRNPIEMALSLHAHLLRDGNETEADFMRAWRLQTPRGRGKQVPFVCDDLNYLLYGSLCLLGEQLERVHDKVHPDRILVVVLDDVRENPQREYGRVLDFLGLPDNRRNCFPVLNEGYGLPHMVAKSLRVADLAKHALGIHEKLGVLAWVGKRLGCPIHRQALPPEFLTELREYFRADVEKLGHLLGMDLSEWLAPGRKFPDHFAENLPGSEIPR